MNTVQKGNIFESRAKAIITTAINEGKLGLIPSCCKVFAKKGYFSRDRNSNIIFDLSIEVWPEDADRCQLLYLIECKDYSNHAVPVDDIEEFVGKIKQVAGLKVKGVFITTNRLQEGAYNYAVSKDLMVIQVDEQLVSKIILHNEKRKKNILTDLSPTWSQEADALSQIDDILENVSATDQDWDQVMYSFLKQHLTSRENWREPGTESIGLEKLSKKLLEKMTTDILNDFAPSIISHGTQFPIERFIEYISERFGIKVISDNCIPQYNGKVLNGYCNFDNKTIHIDKDLIDTGQFLFVLAHELGHLLLHEKVQLPQAVYDDLSNSELDRALGKYALVNDKHWLEWQANQFAASLIMPRRAVLIKLIKWQESQGISKVGRVWLDDQPCNVLDFKKMLTVLGYEFSVSRAILEYRMADLEIITYAKGKRNYGFSMFGRVKPPRHISHFLSRIFDEE